MNTRVTFIFDIDVPENLSYGMRNTLIGNKLGEMSEQFSLTPIEFSWRKEMDTIKRK